MDITELRGWSITPHASDDAQRKHWLMRQAAEEIERLRAENKMFARVIVLGDEDFEGEEWEAVLQAAERIVPLPPSILPE